jgi:hypothetical protein
MSDLRTQLDRVANRVRPTDDPFEQLSRRRRTRHRNHRITAGVLAIAVAAGGSVAVFKAFERAAPERPAPGQIGARVQDPTLVFDVSAHTELSIGRKVTLHSSLSAGSTVSAGVILRSACGSPVIDNYRTPSDGDIRVEIGGSNCEGIVMYPIVAWLVAFVPPRHVPPGSYVMNGKLLQSWHDGGSLPHLTMLGVKLVPGTPTANAGPYPRGAFEACPAMKGVIETDGAGADTVALRFSQLWASGRHGQAHRFIDRSARNLQNWAAAGDPTKMRILDAPGKPARHDGLVRYGCGPAVADKSWEVVIDDGTPSASLDFTIYLVRRAGGWKVWGSY